MSQEHCKRRHRSGRLMLAEGSRLSSRRRNRHAGSIRVYGKLIRLQAYCKIHQAGDSLISSTIDKWLLAVLRPQIWITKRACLIFPCKQLLVSVQRSKHIATYIPHDFVHYLRYNDWMASWTFSCRPHVIWFCAGRISQMTLVIRAIKVHTVPTCRKSNH